MVRALCLALVLSACGAPPPSCPVPPRPPPERHVPPDLLGGWPPEGLVRCVLDEPGALRGVVYEVETTGILGNPQEPLLRTVSVTFRDEDTGREHVASRQYDVYLLLSLGTGYRGAELGLVFVRTGYRDPRTDRERTWLFWLDIHTMTLSATSGGAGTIATHESTHCEHLPPED